MITDSANPPHWIYETALRGLREFDPTDVEQAMLGHAQARAFILAAASYLSERHGSTHMAEAIGDLIAHVIRTEAVLRPQPIETEPLAATVTPPSGDEARPRSKPERMQDMLTFLRQGPSDESEMNAIASTVASAMFLRESKGEVFAIDILRQVKAATSQAAALDRWQPPVGGVN